MSQQKLTIVSVDNFNQTFGNSDYAVFTCQTKENDFITTGVTHNMLQRRGVNIDLLDALVGSTILVNDDTDIRTGEFMTGEERISGIVNGTRINPNSGKPATILLTNSANSNLIKGDLYTAETKDLAAATNAKVQQEIKKEKKALSAQRAAERIRAKALGLTEPTQPVVEAQLETNEEESPF